MSVAADAVCTTDARAGTSVDVMTMACPLCGNAQVHQVHDQPKDYEYDVVPSRRHRVYECVGCGSHYVWPRPTVEELIGFYPADYHAYNEDHGLIARTLVGMRARSRAQEYMRLVSRNDTIRLFDVGAGDCRHFDEIGRYGSFECCGVEISPEMATRARRNGYNVVQGTLETMDLDGHEGQYDIVTMYQLVEHVLDPQELMRRAWQLLRPGGYVLCQLPCADGWERRLFGRYWAGYHWPRHLQMVSREGMRRVLDDAAFTDIRVGSALHIQAGLSLQNLIVGGLGYSGRRQFGKVGFYSLLLLAVSPYCILEHACGRGGMMNARARKEC